MAAKQTPDEILSTLGHFTGSESYTRLRYPWMPEGVQFIITDGVKYLSQSAACGWLIDAIASYQPKIHREFQVWTLTVQGNNATLSCTDGNEQGLAFQRISYTDFPLDEIVLWLAPTEDENGDIDYLTLMLPSEY